LDPVSQYTAAARHAQARGDHLKMLQYLEKALEENNNEPPPRSGLTPTLTPRPAVMC
jgi:uncharacterized protein HemY